VFRGEYMGWTRGTNGEGLLMLIYTEVHTMRKEVSIVSGEEVE